MFVYKRDLIATLNIIILYFNNCTFQVTLVKNLDHYGIDLKEFAQELQQMAASSTACKNGLVHCALPEKKPFSRGGRYIF